MINLNLYLNSKYKKENRRGYIQPNKLDELWFHTGTSCSELIR